jgi:hypothetical protein
VHFDHGEGDERRTRQRAPVVIATRFDLITDYFHAARLQSLTEIKKTPSGIAAPDFHTCVVDRM